MFDFALNFINAVNVKAAFFAHRFGCILWHNAQFYHCVHRMRLDFQPYREAAFGLPKGGHVGAGITWNHRTSPCRFDLPESAQW